MTILSRFFITFSFISALLLGGFYSDVFAVEPASLSIVERPILLPGNPLYFLKDVRRGLSRFFTVNPIKKAKLELSISVEKKAEFQVLQETKPEDKDALSEAAGEINDSTNRLKEHADALSNLGQDFDREDVKDVLEEIDREVKESESLSSTREENTEGHTGAVNSGTDQLPNPARGTLKAFSSGNSYCEQLEAEMERLDLLKEDEKISGEEYGNKVAALSKELGHCRSFPAKPIERPLPPVPPKDEAGEQKMCPALYKPVCGIDGKTYGNSCLAEVAGIKTISEGLCQATTTPPLGAPTLSPVATSTNPL